MKRKIILIGIILSVLLFVACSSESIDDSQGSSQDSLPQANIVDAESTTTVSELFSLSGNYECSWDFSGSEEFAVDPASGIFFIASDGSYYLENVVDSTLQGLVERYALYDASESVFYSWNNQASANLGQRMDYEMYSATVPGNTIAYRTYFDLLENIDYGIECEELAVVTLPSLPERRWI